MPDCDSKPDREGSADLVERTRRRMVEYSIPAGADSTTLVERIIAEMQESARLRAEVERLKAPEGWEDELNAAWAIVNQVRAENERLREAISKAPHPLHCAASSPMWPGACSCWKSRAASDEQGASDA